MQVLAESSVVAKSPERAWLRPLLVWAYVGPSIMVAVTAGFLLAPFLGRRRAFWLLAPGWIRQVAAAFGIRRHLDGWEALPTEIRDGKQPAIFVANHTSLFDPPLIISTLPSRPVFIAKQELAFVPFLGWVIWLAGFIFIDRRRSARAIASLERAAQRIRNGQSIAAFPEGTRTRAGGMLPFKKGVFRLAWEAGVPVVPVGIHGGRWILPRDSWRVSPGEYLIRIGPPLLPQQFADHEELRIASEEAVQKLLANG